MPWLKGINVGKEQSSDDFLRIIIGITFLFLSFTIRKQFADVSKLAHFKHYTVPKPSDDIITCNQVTFCLNCLEVKHFRTKNFIRTIRIIKKIIESIVSLI